MSLEEQVIAKYQHIFDGRMWWGSAPAGTPRTAMSDVFCIAEQVGGEESWFVDNTPKDMENARVQFTLWGERKLEVSAARIALRDAIADSITGDWVTVPMGGPVGTYNETLDLRGVRQDFGFYYARGT